MAEEREPVRAERLGADGDSGDRPVRGGMSRTDRTERRRARRARESFAASNPTEAASREPVTRVGKRYHELKVLGGPGSVGIELVLSIMFGLLAGMWLDDRFDMSPILTIAGFGFGLAAGGRAIYRATVAMRREAAREEAAEGNPSPSYEPAGERDKRRDAHGSPAPLAEAPAPPANPRDA